MVWRLRSPGNYLTTTAATFAMSNFSLKKVFEENRRPILGIREFLKYIGPGLLVTVGFIDPGNWAANMAAGSGFGYNLLWIITLSTVMLVLLQHNAAHIGIVTGLCLSEAATLHLPPAVSRAALATAALASISTSLAEILGGAIAIEMLFNIPLRVGATLTALVVVAMLFTNSYYRLEKMIIGFVSLVGLCFMFELSRVNVDWRAAMSGLVTPTIPPGSIMIVMSVLGAVVMPHNLFLHSEVIQSRQWNLEDGETINHKLKYEFLDTLFSMIVGWGINAAIIIVASATFFSRSIQVTDLKQAQQMLDPLLGSASSLVFALALLFAGISSSVTSGIAGGSIFAGIFGEPYDIKDKHSRAGVCLTIFSALAIIFFIDSPFKGLLVSQIVLSVQLPITIFLQIYLTSSGAVMGQHKNSTVNSVTLWIVAAVVTFLNVLLMVDMMG
jgi:manganese transport protein